MLLGIAAIGAATACWHHAAPGSPADGSVITEQEIDSAHAFNAYDAIRKLRPRFLTSRGRLSVDPNVPPALPNVYVDEMFYGDVSLLRSIEASTIASIRFYDAGEAQYKYGRGNMAGVISITTKH